MRLLPRLEWQAAPADAAQDDDVDESDPEEPEEAADATVGNLSKAHLHSEHVGPQDSSKPVDGPVQQLQLHTSATRQVTLCSKYTSCHDCRLTVSATADASLHLLLAKMYGRVAVRDVVTMTLCLSA